MSDGIAHFEAKPTQTARVHQNLLIFPTGNVYIALKSPITPKVPKAS